MDSLQILHPFHISSRVATMAKWCNDYTRTFNPDVPSNLFLCLARTAWIWTLSPPWTCCFLPVCYPRCRRGLLRGAAAVNIPSRSSFVQFGNIIVSSWIFMSKRRSAFARNEDEESNEKWSSSHRERVFWSGDPLVDILDCHKHWLAIRIACNQFDVWSPLPSFGNVLV